MSNPCYSKCVVCKKDAEIFLTFEDANKAITLCENCLKDVANKEMAIIINKVSLQYIYIRAETLSDILRKELRKYVIICSPDVFEKYKLLHTIILDSLLK